MNTATATLTHRIPKESISVKPTITFSEAMRKVDGLTSNGSYVLEAAGKVYSQYNIQMRRSGMGLFRSDKSFRDAIYALSSRLRRTARKKRQEKKLAVATRGTVVNSASSDTRAFYQSVRGIVDLPIPANKKIDAIRAIL